MRILVLSLFAMCISFANDNATISTSAIPNSNATISNANDISSSETSPQNDIKISDDEKLKNDIITFDRVDYIKEGARIDDPFIYIYPKTEDDIENIQKAQQASFVLNGIFENKASINGIWVESGDTIEGWTVSNIQKDRVELESKFVKDKRVLSANAELISNK